MGKTTQLMFFSAYYLLRIQCKQFHLISLQTYKAPGAKDIPIDFRIKFLQNVNNDGIYGSKATGEPPLTLSIVVQFALRHAIDAVRLDNGQTEKWYHLGMCHWN